jgi:hypothetical protein
VTADSQLSCGHPATPRGPHTTGVAYVGAPDSNERIAVCYSCADEAIRKLMRTGTNRIAGYLSADCKTVTTWTGGVLCVIDSLVVRRGRRGSGQRWTRYYWRSKCAGRRWFGVCPGPGMLTMMRVGKVAR